MKECPNNAKNTVKFKQVSVGQNPFLFTSVELMHFSVATSKRMQDATVRGGEWGVGGYRWKRVKPAAEGSTQHVHCLDRMIWL